VRTATPTATALRSAIVRAVVDRWLRLGTHSGTLHATATGSDPLLVCSRSVSTWRVSGDANWVPARPGRYVLWGASRCCGPPSGRRRGWSGDGGAVLEAYGIAAWPPSRTAGGWRSQPTAGSAGRPTRREFARYLSRLRCGWCLTGTASRLLGRRPGRRGRWGWRSTTPRTRRRPLLPKTLGADLEHC
jgi:hypothetical protein